MKKPKSDYVIQTVGNAFRLLEAFHDSGELGVTQLSKRLGLHKNNVFRLLATLEQGGYIEQCSENDRYRLGVRCLELGRSFARSRTLLRQARPLLESLAAEARETVHLSELRDFEVVHLDGVQPERLVLTGLRIGQRLPAHCTAQGKVLLGCAGDSLRLAYDRYIASSDGLERRTPNTITDRHKFFEHLRTVGVEGYALDLEEVEPGMCCTAAPIYDANGHALAAISVSGPAFWMTEEHMRRHSLPMVTAAAQRLSRLLGASL